MDTKTEFASVFIQNQPFLVEIAQYIPPKVCALHQQKVTNLCLLTRVKQTRVGKISMTISVEFTGVSGISSVSGTFRKRCKISPSSSLTLDATSPVRRGFGIPSRFPAKPNQFHRKRNLFAKGSPGRKDSPGRGRWHASAERGTAGERSETERFILVIPAGLSSPAAAFPPRPRTPCRGWAAKSGSTHVLPHKFVPRAACCTAAMQR